MSPKFKGNSDDWLDSEEESANASRGVGTRAAEVKKAARQDRAKTLPLSDANAVVAEVFPNQCRVRLISTGEEFLSSYRRANVIKENADVRERSPVAVGDRVKVERIGTQNGIVAGVCARTNHLSRPAPGRENIKFQHVIAANVDYLAIVISAKEPDFSAGLVDRYLVAAAFAGIEPIICLTKIDLLSADDPRPTDLYQKLGYTVFEVSSPLSVGIDDLRKKIQGHAVVFSGPSGAGKTSLLRKLLGNETGRVGMVSTATGKGKHTTTAAILLGGPAGSEWADSEWIDTPGVREFGLGEIPPASLAGLLTEFQGLSCPQSGCLHLDEEGCLARNLERYSSYRRILESLIAGEN